MKRTFPLKTLKTRKKTLSWGGGVVSQMGGIYITDAYRLKASKVAGSDPTETNLL